MFYKRIWRCWAETCKILLQIHVRSVTNGFTGEPELIFLRAHLRGLFRSSTFSSGSVTSQWAGSGGWDFQALSAYSCCFNPWTYAAQSTAQGGLVAPLVADRRAQKRTLDVLFYARLQLE